PNPVSGRPWLKAYPPGVPSTVEVVERPLWALLDDSVATYPDNPALEFLGKTYSYRELGRLVDRAAAGFQGLGVGPGVKVGLFLPNCPYFVICYYAVLKAGGTIVNYNPLYAPREVVHQIDDSETMIMVTLDLKVVYDKIALALDQSSLKRVVIGRMAGILPFPQNMLFPIVRGGEVARIPQNDRHVFFDQLVSNDGKPRAVAISPRRDIAVLQYTGGTTGAPKGASLTHYNLWANVTQNAAWFPEVERGRERALCVLPLFHVFAMTAVMNVPLYIGGLIILLPRFDLVQVLKTIDRKRPTIFHGVPTIYTAVNNYKDLARYNLSSIKVCVSGGATLPLEVKRHFESLTGCSLVEGYGLSETSPTVCCNPVHGAVKPGSIGLPQPNTDVQITSIDEPRHPLPPREQGELWVRGPQVMAGYWRREDETKTSITDGWFHTGDVGYMDEEGFFYIVDRLKEVIVAGGYKIYPRNVEEAIYMNPAVAEAAVVGVPDAYRGQTVKAYIVRQKGAALDERALHDFLKDKISPIEMPKIFEFRDELPKSAIGKILKRALVEEHQRQAAAVSGGSVKS
ncbi:MAG TPA: long-chain fatty acid--CoA ligase, partial [Alphaproteobacteria bacterium]|nr:long-chain fatty acid--CoA ligase [Alphaproteobacteria bacterium]